MSKIFSITVLSTLVLALAACGTPAGSSPSASSSGSSSASGGTSNLQNPVAANATPAAGPSALQLAAGMLKLDGTSNAVTAQEAAKLLPLWQSLQQIESTAAPQSGSQSTPGARPNAAMMQQIGAQITLVENAMTPAQIQAITSMNLSRQDVFAIFQQAGISMGGFGQGGTGFRSNGGTFTPPQGTPRAAGTPGAFQGNGGRRGFGNFLPPSVITGIIQYLQKKAGS